MFCLVVGSFQEEALMDHRDVVLQAVTLRYSEEEFMKVGTVEVECGLFSRF